MRYRFGDCEIDVSAYTLRRAGDLIALQPKVFDVLRYLIEHRDRLVTKEQLLDELWPGEHVNEAAVPWSVSHARRALGQKRNQKQPIETVHGRGYRFTAEVQTVTPSLTAPADAAPTSAAPGRRASPFVGRETTMAQLRARLEEACAGRGRLCILRGEAGIGKTRCAHELAALAEPMGMRRWSGRAVEGVGAPVFWPWIQVLRQAQADPVAAQQGVGELLSRLTAQDGAENEADSDAARSAGRFWLFDGIGSLLRRAAAQAPLLLLLDDLHVADAGTIELLRYLAPELRDAAILIVATQRSGIEQAVRSRLRSLTRYGERISMPRLLPEDIAHYLARLASVEEVSPALAQAVHRATAGNPLLVQETVRALASAHGAASLPTLDPEHVRPSELARDVLRGHLATLDEQTRRLLESASVLGGSFELGLLQHVAKLELDPLLDALERAAQAELVVADAPHRYRFAHDLVRDVLYRELPTRQRVRVHRAAGERLSQLSGEPRQNEIALHYYRSLPAGEYDLVTRHAVAAAQAARRVYAFDDAALYYGWALESQALDPEATPRARAELLFACGSAQRWAGRDLAARETLAKLLDVARQHDYSDLLVRAARVLRPTYALSVMPDPLLRDALEHCLRLHPAASAERVSALSQLACMPPYALDMARSKALSGEAMAMARELGNPARQNEAMRARLYALSGPDDIDPLLALADEIAAAEGGRPSWMGGEALAARFAALLYRGDMPAADGALRDLTASARALRLPEAEWFAQRLQAQRLFVDGHFARAEQAFGELSVQNRRTGLSYGHIFVSLLRLLLAVERKGVQAVPGPWDPRVTRPEERATLTAWPSTRATFGRLLAALGHTEMARANLEAAAAGNFQDLPRDIAYLNTLANLAVVAAQLEDRARAEMLYACLAPYPQHNTPSSMLLHDGSVSRYLALLSAALDHAPAVVEAHFETALAHNEQMEARVQLVHTLRDYAGWLERRNAGQRKQAVALRRRQRELARELGMHDL